MSPCLIRYILHMYSFNGYLFASWGNGGGGGGVGGVVGGGSDGGGGGGGGGSDHVCIITYIYVYNTYFVYATDF